jgi:hypothetical protein
MAQLHLIEQRAAGFRLQYGHCLYKKFHAVLAEAELGYQLHFLATLNFEYDVLTDDRLLLLGALRPEWNE